MLQLRNSFRLWGPWRDFLKALSPFPVEQADSKECWSCTWVWRREESKGEEFSFFISTLILMIWKMLQKEREEPMTLHHSQWSLCKHLSSFNSLLKKILFLFPSMLRSPQYSVAKCFRLLCGYCYTLLKLALNIILRTFCNSIRLCTVILRQANVFHFIPQTYS